jgi:hypothetical protein
MGPQAGLILQTAGRSVLVQNPTVANSGGQVYQGVQSNHWSTATAEPGVLTNDGTA